MKTTFKTIRKVNGVEIASNKEYATFESANNAGNSWLNDCTVHAEVRKGYTFEIIEITK